MKWLIPLLFLVSCATQTPPGARKIASEQGWGFLIFSDIHVYTSTKGGKKIVPKSVNILVEKLLSYVDEHNVKFIVLLGDSTGGNVNDGYTEAQASVWWKELRTALQPLMDRGVKILPVAGNHDYYTKAHQSAYKKAWHQFVEPMDGELQFSTENPLYYTLNYGSMELFLLHSVDYKLGAEQEAWLTKTLAERRDSGQLKVAMGHVAGYTRLSKKGSKKHGEHLKKILEAGGVHHYVAGHEHYFWDEMISSTFRQTIMGTSSGTYNYVPHAVYARKVCTAKVCTMGPDALKIPVSGADHKQVHKQMFLHFAVDEEQRSYKLIPMALQKGEIVPFSLP